MIINNVELNVRWRHLFLERGPWHMQVKVEEHPFGSKLHLNVKCCSCLDLGTLALAECWS